MSEPLIVLTVKAFTVRLEETHKQVPSNVTEGIEKSARQASTHKKQQPFVLGMERIAGRTVSIHMDK